MLQQLLVVALLVVVNEDGHEQIFCRFNNQRVRQWPTAKVNASLSARNFLEQQHQWFARCLRGFFGCCQITLPFDRSQLSRVWILRRCRKTKAGHGQSQQQGKCLNHLFLQIWCIYRTALPCVHFLDCSQIRLSVRIRLTKTG